MRDTRIRSRLLPGARATSRSAAATSGTENASSVAIRRIGLVAGVIRDSFRQFFEWLRWRNISHGSTASRALPQNTSPLAAEEGRRFARVRAIHRISPPLDFR